MQGLGSKTSFLGRDTALSALTIASITFFPTSFLRYTFRMASKYCNQCPRKLLLSEFPTNDAGRVLASCPKCYARKTKRRAALQDLNGNPPSKRRVTGPKTAARVPSIPQSRPNPAPESSPNPTPDTRPIPAPPPPQPRPEDGFLPAEQWGWI